VVVSVLADSEGFEPPGSGSRPQDVFAGLEIVHQPSTEIWLERSEAVERRLERPVGKTCPTSSVAGQTNRELAAIEGPRFDESRTFQLTHEMRCRLTGDQEASAYLAGMEPVDVVEQFHDLDLCEGDAELEEGLCETRSQDPVDAAVCVDDPASRGSRYRGDLEAHGRFLPCADDIPSGRAPGVAQQRTRGEWMPSLGATRQGSVTSDQGLR